MLINDPELIKQLKAGICNPKELARYLLDNYSAPKLAMTLADYMIESQYMKPVTISKDEFLAHFRISGFRFEDGQFVPETRGRNKKEV